MSVAEYACVKCARGLIATTWVYLFDKAIKSDKLGKYSESIWQISATFT